jgi:hypothetical protein
MRPFEAGDWNSWLRAATAPSRSQAGYFNSRDIIVRAPKLRQGWIDTAKAEERLHRVLRVAERSGIPPKAGLWCPSARRP